MGRKLGELPALSHLQFLTLHRISESPTKYLNSTELAGAIREHYPNYCDKHLYMLVSRLSDMGAIRSDLVEKRTVYRITEVGEGLRNEVVTFYKPFIT